ncbi:MAG: GNAT family N-acetyltransferase [Brachybacterium sp.]|nr:GNAT family N-acetyltransferase [Brachybacterium sp.]
MAPRDRLPRGYVLREEPPTVPEYVAMRRDAGLSPRTAEQAAPAIAHSWHWVSVRTEGGALAAMGRTLGDGGWYFHIADMATGPQHQRQGLGRIVLETLLERIDRLAPPDPYITLIGDPPGQRLYRSLGFVDVHPSLGMVRTEPPAPGSGGGA